MLKRLDNTNKMTHELYIKNTLTVIIKYIVSKQKTLRKKDKNQNTTSKSLQQHQYQKT